jgi:cell division septation protein DedD
MSPHEEEDYELVLGNRQLFFLAIVLFGVFFSIGYTVGYSRGRDVDDVLAASQAPRAAEAPRSEPPIPAVEPVAANGAAKSTEALYSPAAKSGETRSRKLDELSAAPAPATAPAKPVQTSDAAAAASSRGPGGGASAGSSPTPVPSLSPAVSSATSNKQTRPGSSQAQPAPGGSNPSSEPAAPTPTVAVPAIRPGTFYLQVLASKEADPARKELIDLKAKGHPVTLDNHDPEWFRILVGPFETREAANAYQLKLESEGLKPFLRKF